MASESQLLCLDNTQFQEAITEEKLILPTMIYNIMNDQRQNMETDILKMDLCLWQSSEAENKVYLYKILFLDQDGNIQTVRIDARTGDRM
jgi:hypothetical protein